MLAETKTILKFLSVESKFQYNSVLFIFFFLRKCKITSGNLKKILSLKIFFSHKIFTKETRFANLKTISTYSQVHQPAIKFRKIYSPNMTYSSISLGWSHPFPIYNTEHEYVTGFYVFELRKDPAPNSKTAFFFFFLFLFYQNDIKTSTEFIIFHLDEENIF